MGKDAKDMTLEEMIQLKEQFAMKDPADITPEQRRGLVRLEQEINRATTADLLSQRDGHSSLIADTEKFDSKAAELWPELGTTGSPFEKAVAKYMADNPRKGDPQEMLIAANMVGVEMGMSPKGSGPKPGTSPTGQVKGGNGGADENTNEEDNAFLKRTSNIAKRYAGVLDLGDKEVVARIEAFADEKEEE